MGAPNLPDNHYLKSEREYVQDLIDEQRIKHLKKINDRIILLKLSLADAEDKLCYCMVTKQKLEKILPWFKEEEENSLSDTVYALLDTLQDIEAELRDQININKKRRIAP